MGKWLVSVKNSKNSLIFANLGCLGMFGVKKTKKQLKKANFQAPTPMLYSKSDFTFCVDHQGACCYGKLKKKSEI